VHANITEKLRESKEPWPTFRRKAEAVLSARVHTETSLGALLRSQNAFMSHRVSRWLLWDAPATSENLTAPGHMTKYRQSFGSHEPVR
jgi:hypothetical protein